MKNEIIILVDEPRTGKTINRKEIAKAYNCNVIIDSLRLTANDFNCNPKDKILVISSHHPKNPFDKRSKLPGKVISVNDARKKVGKHWISI